MSVLQWIYASWQDYNRLLYRAGFWLGFKIGVAIAVTRELMRP